MAVFLDPGLKFESFLESQLSVLRNHILEAHEECLAWVGSGKTRWHPCPRPPTAFKTLDASHTDGLQLARQDSHQLETFYGALKLRNVGRPMSGRPMSGRIRQTLPATVGSRPASASRQMLAARAASPTRQSQSRPVSALSERGSAIGSVSHPFAPGRGFRGNARVAVQPVSSPAAGTGSTVGWPAGLDWEQLDQDSAQPKQAQQERFGDVGRVQFPAQSSSSQKSGLLNDCRSPPPPEVSLEPLRTTLKITPLPPPPLTEEPMAPFSSPQTPDYSQDAQKKVDGKVAGFSMAAFSECRTEPSIAERTSSHKADGSDSERSAPVGLEFAGKLSTLKMMVCRGDMLLKVIVRGWRGAAVESIENRFRVAPVWQPVQAKLNRMGTNCLIESVRSKHLGSPLSGARWHSELQHGETTDLNALTKTSACDRIQGFVLQPVSVYRMVWMVCSLLLLVYDIIIVPLELFEIPDNEALTIVDWLAIFFWTLDIPLNFWTGIIHVEGTIDLRLKVIAKNYLRGWFVPDVCLVSMDYAALTFQSTTVDNSISTIRNLRILRIFRATRLLKIRGLVDWMKQRLKSDTAFIFLDIGRILASIILIVHVIACMWWGIGKVSIAKHDDRNWISEEDIVDEPFAYQYSTSFHWSLTQFSSSMDIQPHNSMERGFAIAVLLFAFVVSAAFVSCLTTSMTRLQIVGSQKSKQFATLRKYLVENRISSKLTLRICRNALHVHDEQEKSTPESEVACLDIVSEPLRKELHYELYAPGLKRHPFFQYFGVENPGAMRRICHKATSMLSLSKGDILFSDGEICKDAYVFLAGSDNRKKRSLEYRQYQLDESVCIFGNSQGEGFELKQEIISETFISEPAIWTSSWTHRGDLVARTRCNFIVLNVEQFHHIASLFKAGIGFPALYATEFVQELNTLEQGQLSDMVEDMHLDVHEIVANIFEPGAENDDIWQPEHKKPCTNDTSIENSPRPSGFQTGRKSSIHTISQSNPVNVSVNSSPFRALDTFPSSAAAKAWRRKNSTGGGRVSEGSLDNAGVLSTLSKIFLPSRLTRGDRQISSRGSPQHTKASRSRPSNMPHRSVELASHSYPSGEYRHESRSCPVGDYRSDDLRSSSFSEFASEESTKARCDRKSIVRDTISMPNFETQS